MADAHMVSDHQRSVKTSMKIRWVAPCIPRALLFVLLSIYVSTIALFAAPQAENRESLTKDYTMGKKYHDRVALIETGEDGVRVRLDLVEAAHKTIDISYYTFTRGKFTNVLLSLLLSAADRGVHVRILCDGLTSLAYEKKELNDALRAFETHPNIEVKYYEKFNLLTPWAWQKRLHDKILIVDDKLALIGGRNIGDKYFMKDEYQQDFVNDRDALLYHDGTEESVIADMQHYYDQVWEYKHTKVHKKNITTKQREEAELTLAGLRAFAKTIRADYPELFQQPNWRERTLSAKAIEFVHNPLGRRKKDPWCLKALLEVASQAQSSIFVQSPYIIPTKSMQKLIRTYDINMELVTVMTNSKLSSPNPIAMGGYYNHRKMIVDKADQVYEYQGPDSIHGKSYAFDDAISIVGTFNIDSRSSYINTESMVIIHSEEFASDLKREIQTYMDNSVLVQADYTYGGEAKDKKPLWLFSKFVGLFEYYL